MATLTQQDIASYHERGYLIPRFTLSKERVDRLRTTLDRLLHDNPGVRPEKLVSAHVVGKGGHANPEGIKGSKDFLDLAMAPDILDMVAQLIGPDIILWGCHVFCKPAGDGQETPWHQDGHYWPIRPLANVTVWVALDASTRENGCLRVIPGSHKAKIIHAHLKEDRDDVVLSQRTDDSAFDPAQAVDLELQPGQMSMHEVYTIHGAQVNLSSQRRAGVALRYMPGSSVFERNLRPAGGQSGVPVAFATRPLWLVRGKDQTGHNNFETGFS